MLILAGAVGAAAGVIAARIFYGKQVREAEATARQILDDSIRFALECDAKVKTTTIYTASMN